MNNFEIHEKAQELTDTHSSYALARMFLEGKQLLEDFHRYCQDEQYFNSPFEEKVLAFLKQNS